MLNSYYQPDATTPKKRAVPGISASRDPKRLISVLQRLELLPSDLATSLTALAAAGGNVGDHYQVVEYRLDEKLQGNRCVGF